MKRIFSAFVLIGFVLLLTTRSSSASGPLILTDGDSSPLLSYIEILNDDAQLWSISDVSSSSFDGLFSPTESDNFGHITATNWLRFTITNAGDYDLPFYLELSYPRIDSIELFIPNASGSYRTEQLEHLKDFSTRKVLHRYFTFSETIKRNGTVTYYMRLHSSGIGSMNFPLTLYTESSFIEKVNNETLLFGMFFGILILIMIYNVFLYFFFKRPNFLFFVLYVLCYILAQAYDSGYAFQYLWPQSVFMEESFIYVIMLSLFISLYSFTIKFLDTKKTLPIFHKIFTAITLLTSLSAVLIFLLTALKLPNTESLAVQANNAYNLLFRFGFTLSLLATGILCLLKGKKEARFYVLAWTGMDVAVLLGGLRYFAFMNQNILTANANQIGSVLLIFFLSLSLSDQLRIIQRQKDLLHKEIQSSNEKIIHLNVLLEQTVQKRKASIKNLLDHADQGFLYFGENLLVSSEYSSICQEIFGIDIGAKHFLDLLPLDKQTKNDSTKLLSSVFKEALLPESLLSKLPSELVISHKRIHLHYKYQPLTIKSGVVMVILTDVSQTHALEVEISNKNRELEHIVKFLIHNNFFLQCVRSYIEFAESLTNTTNAKHIQLTLHTFGESFRFFEMEDFVLKLQMIEQVISSSTDSQAVPIEGDLLLSWLFEAIQELEMTLGTEFLAYDEVISLEIDRIKNLEKQMKQLLPPDSPIVESIKQLRYKPFNTLLANYSIYVEKLAERLDKCVNPIMIESDDLLVNIEYYGAFAKSLIHVFRNSISHGIELPDDRVAMDKSEFGQISCSIEYKNETIQLSISDDGQGIIRSKIKDKALEKGLFTEDILATISDETLLNLIFTADFSTASETTELSGRGVGLAAVVEEVLKLHGSYKVESIESQGTRFIFTLPFVEATL